MVALPVTRQQYKLLCQIRTSLKWNSRDPINFKLSAYQYLKQKICKLIVKNIQNSLERIFLLLECYLYGTDIGFQQQMVSESDCSCFSIKPGSPKNLGFPCAKRQNSLSDHVPLFMEFVLSEKVTAQGHETDDH